MRNWNIKDIKESNLPNEVKEIIEREYNGETLSTLDPNNYSQRTHTYQEFKEEYKKYLVFLVQLLGDNYFFTDILHKRYQFDDIEKYGFGETDLTDEDLLEHVLDFYDWIGDEEIYVTMSKLLDEKNGHIRIQPYDESNPICKEVRGRCIKPKTGDVFMSYYMRGTSEDLSILGHETGHMLSHALFNDKINPIVSGFLSETESYLFELLMNSYIANELNLPDLALHLEANRTQKTVDTIWNIRAQQILYRQFGNKPNLKRLTRILNKEGLQIDYTKANFNDITTFNLFELHHLLHSHLVALHFYKRIMEDQEKGINEFKRFMTSDKQSTYALFNESGIYYEDLIGYMDHMYEKAVTLKKRYNKL